MILPKLIWDPPVPDDLAVLEAKVLEHLRTEPDLKTFQTGKQDWCELLYHHFPLVGNDYRGPSVLCFGDDATKGTLSVSYEAEVQGEEMDISGSPAAQATGINKVFMPKMGTRK